MSCKAPSLPLLFVQLNLAADELAILRFIRHHRPLPDSVDLLHAPFWTPAQAAVLWKLQRRGSPWCGVLAQFEAALRSRQGVHQESA